MASAKVTPTKQTKATTAKVQKQSGSEKKSKGMSYVEMVVQSIVKLTDETRDGASRDKIIKYINSNFTMSNETENMISKRIKMALKKCIDEDYIIQKTGNGLNGSFRLNAEQKKKFMKGNLYEKKNAPTSKENGEKNKTPVKKAVTKPKKSPTAAKLAPAKKSATAAKKSSVQAKKSPAPKKAAAKKAPAKK